MSMWTYIQGVITVEPAGRSQPEKEYCLKTVLAHLPEVSGSEGPMEVYVNQVQGHNCSANHDEFMNHSNLGQGRFGRMFYTQDEYLITLNAYLRDRTFPGVYKDFMKWAIRLAKRVHVKNLLVKIVDYDEEKIITNDDDYFSDLYEYDDNWADFLFWDYERDEDGNLLSGKPKTHKQGKE